MTLTEEEDTGPERAAIEAAARDETSPTQTATLLTETNSTISPEDLVKLAQETQRSGNTRKLRILGAATNVLGEDGLPLTVNHAPGGQGTGAQPVTIDEWSWIPETGMKGGTCGGSMMCWRIAQSVAAGTATLPEGPINIVEAQEKGFAACDECQINTQRLATALNREIWLFTLDSERNLRLPLIFNP